MLSANNNYNLIKDAYTSLNKRKFTDSILILEGILSSGVGDIYILFLLSVAYLYSNQFAKAGKFIAKIKEIDPGYLPVIQLDAFLRLKSSISYKEAMEIYLALVSKYPADPHLHRGRKLVRNAEDFQDLQRVAKLSDFVNIPRPPKRLKKSPDPKVYVGKLKKHKIKINRKKSVKFSLILKIVSITAIVILVVLSGWYIYNSGIFQDFLKKSGKSRPDFITVDMVTVSGTDYDLIKSINKKEVSHYYTSVHKMTDDFNRARRLIKNEKYNDAVLLLNRIYNSNVNFVVKEKVEFLLKFLINLDDRNFEAIEFKKVNKKKYLYRGYSIKWKGRVDSLKEKGGNQTFRLQVDYISKDRFSGEADVYSDHIIKGLARDSMVVVDGVFVSILGEKKRIYLVADKVQVLH